MPLIIWNEGFSVNIKEIDEQHKKLFNLINMLHDAMKKGGDKEVLAEILQGLVDYTKYHFSTEEKYMSSFKYPDYHSHKAEHGEFIEKVLEFCKDFSEDKIGLSILIMPFLTDWLSNHILVNDKKYGSYFNKMGIK